MGRPSPHLTFRRTRRAATAVVLAVGLAGAGCSGGDSGEVAGATTSSSPTPSAGAETTVAAQGSTSASGSTAGPATSLAPGHGAGSIAATAASSTTAARAGPGLPPSTPPSQPVVTGAPTGQAATGLKSEPECENGRAVVRLTWSPAGSADQLVAVSARPDGLDSGNYTTSGVLTPSHASYLVRESQPGGIYYWRVLTRLGTGWAASGTAQYEGPTCVAF